MQPGLGRSINISIPLPISPSLWVKITPTVSIYAGGMGNSPGKGRPQWGSVITRFTPVGKAKAARPAMDEPACRNQLTTQICAKKY